MIQRCLAILIRSFSFVSAQRREPVFRRLRFFSRPFHQQPFLRMHLSFPVIPMRRTHPHSRKAGSQLSIRTFTPSNFLEALAGSVLANFFPETGRCSVFLCDRRGGRPVHPPGFAGRGCLPGAHTVIELCTPTTSAVTLPSIRRETRYQCLARVTQYHSPSHFRRYRCPNLSHSDLRFGFKLQLFGHSHLFPPPCSSAHDSGKYNRSRSAGSRSRSPPTNSPPHGSSLACPLVHSIGASPRPSAHPSSESRCHPRSMPLSAHASSSPAVLESALPLAALRRSRVPRPPHDAATGASIDVIRCQTSSHRLHALTFPR